MIKEIKIIKINPATWKYEILYDCPKMLLSSTARFKDKKSAEIAAQEIVDFLNGPKE